MVLGFAVGASVGLAEEVRGREGVFEIYILLRYFLCFDRIEKINLCIYIIYVYIYFR